MKLIRVTVTTFILALTGRAALDEKFECRPGALRNRLMEKGDSVEVDVGGGGPDSPGYVIVFDGGELSHVDSGAVIGQVVGRCVATQKSPPYYCNMIFVIDDEGGSSVAMQGMFDDMIVTGGSGCYEGATGTVSGQNLEEEDTFMYYLDVHY